MVGRDSGGAAGMHFFQFLKSLDALLFEVTSWLVFYPVTLWRTLRHPVAMMDYAASELKQPPEDQYDDSVSPPIMLLLTVVLAHGLEIALIGESKLIAETRGFAGLISDDTSLILLRLVAFAAFPLLTAVQTVRGLRKRLTRATLEPHFFAQCYATAPFALLTSLAATFSQVREDWSQLLAGGLLAFSVFGYLAVQTAAFRKTLNVGVGVGLVNALIGYAQALAFMVALGWLAAGVT